MIIFFKLADNCIHRFVIDTQLNDKNVLATLIKYLFAIL